MKFLLSAIMLVVTPSILAQTPEKTVSLEELQTHLKAYAALPGFESNFQQIKFINSMNVRLKSRGTLKVNKPHNVEWKIIEPSPLLVRIGEKKLEMTSGEGAAAQKQVVDLTQIPEGMKNLAHLTTWLKLDPVELNQNYDVVKNSDNRFTFRPKNLKDSLFESFDMNMDQKGHLKTLTLTEKSQDRLEMQFSPPKPFKGEN